MSDSLISALALIVTLGVLITVHEFEMCIRDRLKATKVDGIYSADPFKDPEAVRYERLTYDEALARKLGVMDATAIVMCRENDIPLKVFNINRHGDLVRVVCGENVGTTVVRE